MKENFLTFNQIRKNNHSLKILLSGKLFKDTISENAEKLKQYYLDRKFLEKQCVLKNTGAMVLYSVMILFYLMKWPFTSVQDKMMIVAPLAYFIHPTDLIPDYLAGAGYVDDGVAIMTCLQKLSTSITSEIQQPTDKQYQQMIGKVDADVVDKIVRQIKVDKIDELE